MLKKAERTMMVRFDEHGRKVVLTAINITQAMTVLDILEQDQPTRIKTAYGIAQVLDGLQKEYKNKVTESWWDAQVGMSVKTGSGLTIETSRPVPARVCVFLFYACTNVVGDQHDMILKSLKMFIAGIDQGICHCKFESAAKYKKDAPKTGRIN